MQIEVEISKNEVKPGADLDITVNTNLGSFVGLLGVDQSVLIMKSGNDIEHSSVFDELDAYNKADRTNRQWGGRSMDSNTEDFKNSDTVIITNAEHGGIFLRKKQE